MSFIDFHYTGISFKLSTTKVVGWRVGEGDMQTHAYHELTVFGCPTKHFEILSIFFQQDHIFSNS